MADPEVDFDENEEDPYDKEREYELCEPEPNYESDYVK